MLCGKKTKARSPCPVTFALDRIGDKWSLLIVRDLLFRGFKTYGDFLNAGEGIATNVLADRLRCLESEGIIGKSRDPDNRRRYLYRLTDKGYDLAPILLEMMCWSARHDPNFGMPEPFMRRIQNDRKKLLKELRKGIIF